jgi:hypothetical protein
MQLPKTKPGRPFFLRHRTGLAVATVVVIGLGVASVYSGFWGYNGPFGYASRVIQDGVRQERTARSWNAGQQDITASFVNDYIKAKYYGGQQTNVGYKSVYAGQPRTVKLRSGESEAVGGLEKNVTANYASMQPGFDPLLCSGQVPAAVHYATPGFSGMGLSSVLVSFSYAGTDVPNVVRYDLQLDQSKSDIGEWQVTNVVCAGLEMMPTRPYTTYLDQTAPGSTHVPREYMQRNDRVFTIAR